METRRLCPECGRRTPGAVCHDDGTQTVALLKFDPRAQIKPGDVIAGRYEVTEVIGKGGYGSIYGARHTGTGQEIALKVMRADFDGHTDAQICRFFREARVTARLDHPNTVRVFDVGQTPGGSLYIAMERLVGPSLEALLQERADKNEVLSEPETIDIAIPVLQSLQEAHLHGLVHRDLKPANVVLADFGDGEKTVKVLDFGIAWMASSSLTTTGMAVGTPAYMSPEQCEAVALGGRSDLYSLGIVLYRCVTGDVPFAFDNPVAIMQAHLDEPLPSMKMAAKVPISDEFVAVVEKALTKEVGDRWQDARSMRKALEALRSRLWAKTPIALPAARRQDCPESRGPVLPRPAPFALHQTPPRAPTTVPTRPAKFGPDGLPTDLPDAAPVFDARQKKRAVDAASAELVLPDAVRDAKRSAKQMMLVGGGAVAGLTDSLKKGVAKQADTKRDE